jgi:hypothetical protein
MLVELLAQRGWGTSAGGVAGGAEDAPEAQDARGDAGDSTGGAHRHDCPPTEGAPGGRHDQSTGAPPAQSPCTCDGATPAACRICPVCQLIAFVQQVNPDAIERVADVVALAATALRDLATAQRDRRAGEAARDAQTTQGPAETEHGDEAGGAPR